MKRKVKGILVFGLSVLMLVLIIFVYNFSNEQLKNVKFAKLTIGIKADGDYYLNEDDINSWLKRHKGDVLGVDVEKLDVGRIERILRSNIYVGDVEVYRLGLDELCIDIQQRVPMIKVRDVNGKMFVISKDGVILPYNIKYPTKILYCNGEIKFKNLYYGLQLHQLQPTNRNLLRLEKFGEKMHPNVKSWEDAYKNGRSKMLHQDSAIYVVYEENMQSYKLDMDDERNLLKLKEIYDLSNFIIKDKFLNSLIVQLYIDKNNEYTFVTNVGGFLVRFGLMEYPKKTVDYGYMQNENSIQIRFDNLKAFYENGFEENDYPDYKEVDLRFKNQIVCKKRK